MAIKALFLDFYGTIVHEDDDIIPGICRVVQQASAAQCSASDIGAYWWKVFMEKFHNSYGPTFETQQVLSILSLAETIRHFDAECDAETIIEEQFVHWECPGIFADSMPFLERNTLPKYILSNIDTDAINKAIAFHGIQVDGVITSEDVRSYKPRPEIFHEALRKYGLDKQDVLHIGDSLTSDIQGAQGAGIQAAWVNRKGKTAPDPIRPDYMVQDLLELERVL